MDENDSYGYAMAKPLPYGCIKKTSKVPSLLEFNKIFGRIFHEDKVGYLLIVDIKFHNKNEKRCFLMKYTPPFSRK